MVATPTINALDPASGIVGTTVTVTGTSFGAATGALKFDGSTIPTTSWSDTSITFDVPMSALPGSRDVMVTAAGKDSNVVPFEVTLPRTVYVNNDQSPTNSVSAYAMDAAGSLAPLAGSPFTTGGPPGLFGGDASELYLDREHRRLFASNTTTIAVFDIDPVSGALTAVTGSPFNANGNRNFGLTATEDGQFLYAAQFDTQTVTLLSVGGNGAVTPVTGSSFAASSVDTLHLLHGEKFLAASTESSTLLVYSVDPATRALTPVTGSPFATGNTFTSRANPAGTRIYIPAATNGLEVYDIDDMTGAATAITGSPFAVSGATRIHSMAFRPDGQVLYLGDYNSGKLNVFSIAASGAPTAIASSPFTMAGVGRSSSMAVTSDGGFLVIQHESDRVISVFSLAADGTPTAVTNSPFAMDITVGGPSGLAIGQ